MKKKINLSEAVVLKTAVPVLYRDDTVIIPKADMLREALPILREIYTNVNPEEPYDIYETNDFLDYCEQLAHKE